MWTKKKNIRPSQDVAITGISVSLLTTFACSFASNVSCYHEELSEKEERETNSERADKEVFVVVCCVT